MFFTDVRRSQRQCLHCEPAHISLIRSPPDTWRIYSSHCVFLKKINPLCECAARVTVLGQYICGYLLLSKLHSYCLVSIRALTTLSMHCELKC